LFWKECKTIPTDNYDAKSTKQDCSGLILMLHREYFTMGGKSMQAFDKCKFQRIFTEIKSMLQRILHYFQIVSLQPKTLFCIVKLASTIGGDESYTFPFDASFGPA
jgi:hypothetical protein